MYQRLTSLLASKKFFYGLLIVLVFQALWIALSGRYPMAFDEDFHLGIIRLYAHHLSPFWSYQPTNADMFGAVFRDPSYLYHYLLSFPYRLISLLRHSGTSQVLVLRFINIGLFASAMPLYRRLLLKTGASRATVHVVLTFFILIPIVPFVAAQINYDNLLLPLTALSLLLTASISQELKKSRQLNTLKLAELLVLGLFTALVKYAFLPILVAIGVFLGIEFYYYLGRQKQFWRTLVTGVSAMPRRSLWFLLIGFVLASGLCLERYGLNLVHYHDLVPDCADVLGVQKCSAYSPWVRDYNFAAAKATNLRGPVGYSSTWGYGMWLRSFFAVDGPATQFETRGPLLLPSLAAIPLLGFGLMFFLIRLRPIFKKYDATVLGILILASLFYLFILWLDGYRSYLKVGQPVAINGRYLLPILLPLMVIVALGYVEALRNHQRLRLAIAIIGIICFAWGGGFLTYVLRSRESWYWPNRYVVNANRFVRQGLSPIVPGTKNPIQFLP